MSKTITRLYDGHTQALGAIEDLEQAGIDHHDISLISNGADNWHHGHKHHAADAGDESETLEGAGEGAGAGGVIGAAAGLMAGLGMLAIPGLGPVVAAGWLASTLTGAAVGAAAGAATGGILGALKDAGHSDEEAHVYAEGVRRGGTLISVKTHSDIEARRVEQLLDRSGVNTSARGVAYRESGWDRFDPEAQPYSAEQVRQERLRYDESRSFASTGDVMSEDLDSADRAPLGGFGADQPRREF